MITFGQSFSIHGAADVKLNNLTVFLIQQSTKDTISQSPIKNGEFNLTGSVSNAVEFYYIILSDTAIRPKKSAMILIEPKKLNLKIDGSHWPNVDLVGSKSHDEYLYCKKVWDSLPNDSIRIQAMMGFVRDNPNSNYAPNLLYRLKDAITMQQISRMYNGLSPSSQASYYGSILSKYVGKLSGIINTFKMGGEIPNISLTKMDEKKIDLKDVISGNKLTLIDFWASWCGPCREQIPHLKSLYEKFRNEGFQILSIAIGDTKRGWKAALEKNAMNWIQCIDTDNSIDNQYSIGAIPAMILVDGNGKILAYDCPRSIVSPFGPSLHPDGLHETIRVELSRTK